jgi:hypothetical protein
MGLLELLHNIKQICSSNVHALYYTLSIIAIIFLTIALSSCSLRQQQLLFKDRGPNPDSLSAVLKNSGNGTSDYRIRSQDILQIRNLQNIKYIVEERLYPPAAVPILR